MLEGKDSSSKSEAAKNGNLSAASLAAESVPPKFSFQVTKQTKKEVVKSTFLTKSGIIEQEEEEITQKRGVAYLENGIVRDTDDFPVKKKQKKEYLIPMKRTGNDWRIERLKKIIEEGSGTEEDKARLALMIDTFGGGDNQDEEEIRRNGSINFMASMDIEDMTEADYNEVPIGEFGLAFLRGCGWKEGDGIGKSNRKAVKLHISEPRPKGLGLGADVNQAGKQKKDLNGKVKELEKKARVKIVSGTDRGRSGEVQSMDEDNSSCFVKLDNTEKIVRVSRFALEILDKKS